MMYHVPVGVWNVTELLTLQDCHDMAEQGCDVRFENGRAFIVIYEEMN